MASNLFHLYSSQWTAGSRKLFLPPAWLFLFEQRELSRQDRKRPEWGVFRELLARHRPETLFPQRYQLSQLYFLCLPLQQDVSCGVGRAEKSSPGVEEDGMKIPRIAFSICRPSFR
jgi:hypothetical protein